MSVHKSYFSRNNTLIFGSRTNTGQSPYTELFFGSVDNVISPVGFSRFIFDLDLTDLRKKVADGTIRLAVPGQTCSGETSHILHMTNTSSFDKELLNDKWSNGKRRASSFTLNLYRIPFTVSSDRGEPQYWDEGVGFDYYANSNDDGGNTQYYTQELATDKTYSDRPSNYFNSTTTTSWSTPGIYSNVFGDFALITEEDLVLVDSQKFEFGNEDIHFDMSKEIEGILRGQITSTGYIIAFPGDIENISGMTESHSVGFFTRHTQTFYEPYLETTYDDLIEDDRNLFINGHENKLYLYSYENGVPKNLDRNPFVDILDLNYEPIQGFTGLSTCRVTKGVYVCKIEGLTGDTIPCMYYDNWNGIEINEKQLKDVENSFIIKEESEKYNIGISTYNPKRYSFNFTGIKQDEKILTSDIRKIEVDIKEAYSTNKQLVDFLGHYRLYVKEGTTEVMVQDWTRINRTNDGNHFYLDMNDKIPNEYFLDIKVETDGETNTYKRELKFQIVNRK